MSDTTTRRGRHVADLLATCIRAGCTARATTVNARIEFDPPLENGLHLSISVPHVCNDHASRSQRRMVVGEEGALSYRDFTPRHRADEPLDRLVSLLNSPAAFDRHMATLRDLDQAGHFPEFGEEG